MNDICCLVGCGWFNKLLLCVCLGHWMKEQLIADRLSRLNDMCYTSISNGELLCAFYSSSLTRLLHLLLLLWLLPIPRWPQSTTAPAPFIHGTAVDLREIQFIYWFIYSHLLTFYAKREWLFALRVWLCDVLVVKIISPIPGDVEQTHITPLIRGRERERENRYICNQSLRATVDLQSVRTRGGWNKNKKNCEQRFGFCVALPTGFNLSTIASWYNFFRAKH